MNLRWRIRNWLILAEIEWLAWRAAYQFIKREMWRR